MKVVKGNILIATEGFETANINEYNRDRAVRDFYEMKSNAERNNDRFYALESLFTHQFSYGEYYPGFMNLTWQEFQSKNSLKGIEETTYELMHTFCQCPSITQLCDEHTFLQKDEPRVFAGYCNPQKRTSFINNKDNWEEWHRTWYVAHQDKIDWHNVNNKWFPRMDLINAIIMRELYANLKESEIQSIDKNKFVVAFHEKVMRKQGCNLSAYAESIGSEICVKNYYKEEIELSKIEQQAAGNSLRKVFSIINSCGEQQFISIDFKHGMFEFHDGKGCHLGEYHFDGTYNADSDSTHDLKCLDQWRRQNK